MFPWEQGSSVIMLLLHPSPGSLAVPVPAQRAEDVALQALVQPHSEQVWEWIQLKSNSL